MSYGDSCSHPSGYEQGNIGYSGTPLWKIRQQMQAQRQLLDAPKEREEELEILSTNGPRLLADATVLADDQGPKRLQPYARHVLVKDLRKVAQVLKIPLPRQGIFEDSAGLARIALAAIFDGQCVAHVGGKAAESYCRSVTPKLLGNLSGIGPHQCNQSFVKAALLKTFEDLEAELARLGTAERCGAAVALVIGSTLFTAMLGHCSALVCQPASGRQGSALPLHFVPTELGSRGRRAGPAAESLGLPEVSSVDVSVDQSSPFVVLASAAVADCLPLHEMVGVAVNFLGRPRAASGGIAAKALERLRPGGAGAGAGAGGAPGAVADCVAAVAFFSIGPPGNGGAAVPAQIAEPPGKRAKVDSQALQSVRVRQVLVRHKDAKQPVNPVQNRPVTRTRAEAEALLRSALGELLKDGEHRGDSMWAAKSTPTIQSVCRATSECRSSLKGGSMCGDLGWLGKKELQAFGKEAEEAIRNLVVGEWSDVLPSEQGVHLVMRIA